MSSLLLSAATCLLAVASLASAFAPLAKKVILISVDGMHPEDLQYMITHFPDGGMARLAKRGRVYTQATLKGSSDSFPGLLSLITGGSARSHSVFYDDAYDRTLYPPGSNCMGPPGTEVLFDESRDNLILLGNPTGTQLDPALAQLDPTQLPMQMLSNGSCVPFYPHSYPTVNNVFEIIKDAGMMTAWSDKHPAYDLVNGKSGNAVDDLYCPEIQYLTNIAFYSSKRHPIPVGVSPCNNNTYPIQTTDLRLLNSNTDYQINTTTDYDYLKVMHLLDVIRTGQYSIMGMNFQSLSIAQKTSDCKGGYLPNTPKPTKAFVKDALGFVDVSIKSMIRVAKEIGVYDETAFIISAKHGQSPRDLATLVKIDHALIDNYVASVDPSITVAQSTTDTLQLLWLTNPANASAARAIYERPEARAMFNIDTVAIGHWYYPNKNRSPDVMVIGKPGTIYSLSTKKVMEHGGFSPEEVHVGLLVSSPHGIPYGVDYSPVYTQQVAPTILRILGLNYTLLEAYAIEGHGPLIGVRP